MESIQTFSTTNEMTVVETLGYFLHKTQYNCDKKIAKIGHLLYTNRDVHLHSDISVLEALHLVERLKIGRGPYTNMRLLLLG